MRKILLWRWTFYVVGMLVLSLGITMTIKGQRLGIGPWDVLHVGLYQNLGLSIGSWGIITAFVIVIATTIAIKKLPKLGTWINMFAIGIFIDFFNWLIPEFTSLGGQTAIFSLGVLVMCYGVGLYVSPNMGAGPRDNLMLVSCERTGSIKQVRTTIEVTVALLGWLLGGPVGIGTIIIALFIGQIVHYTLPQCQKLLLKVIGKTKEELLFLPMNAKKV